MIIIMQKKVTTVNFLSLGPGLPAQMEKTSPKNQWAMEKIIAPQYFVVAWQVGINLIISTIQ